MLRSHPIDLRVRLVLETHGVALTLFEALNACVAFKVEDRRFILYTDLTDAMEPSSALPLLTYDGVEFTGDPTLLELAQHAVDVLQTAMKKQSQG